MPTEKTKPVTIPKAKIGNCPDDNDNLGCSTRGTVIAYLPLTAQVTAIRQYTNAGGPGGDHAMEQVPPGRHAWCEVYPPSQYTTPQNTVVEFVFRNWSGDRAREAALKVDWE